jgi:uncharacterized repeat protein (TIGR01451 family)
MDIKLISVFLFIFSTVSGQQAGKIHEYRFEDNEREMGMLMENQSVIINYSLKELGIEAVSNPNGTFYRLSIPGHNLTTDPGKPELPVLNRLISVPDGSQASIMISEVKSTRINPSKKDFKGVLFPSQHGETKQRDTGKPDFVIDKTIYGAHGILNSDTVKIEYLGKLRSKSISNLSIYPVRYNPESNNIEVITSMKIEITFPQNVLKSSKSASSESALFNDILSKGILNYYPDQLITGYSDQPVGMIIVADTTFRKSLEPYLRWKMQKGFRINLIYPGKDGTGKTYQEIKQSVSSVYKAFEAAGTPPEYLLLVGDVEKIPYYGNGNISDMYYGEFDGGGDFIPEMFVGRIPATDTSDVKSVVEKIIQYEKFGFSADNLFYSRALALAGKDANYANIMNGQIKYAITNYLKSDNKLTGYHFYYPDGSTKKDSTLKLINNGLTFINYTGHGSASGWLHLDLKSPDIANMSNLNKYPFVISNACRTAQYTDTASFGNKFVLARGKGAIGFIGCSNDSYWDEDFFWAVGSGTPGPDPTYTVTGLGAYDRLFHTHGEDPSDWFISMGQVNYAGNLSVSSSSSLRKKYYWETYTLIGDPSVIPILGKPGSFNISLPDTLPSGIKSLSVTGDPFSYISVSHFDNLWDASYFSPSGSAVLEFPTSTYDSCLVVVTGQNKMPIIKTIYFSDINKEYINLTRSVLTDSLDNNNGKADFGETIFLNLIISNLGNVAATNLSARISSTSPWLTIIKNSTVIGTLAGKSEIQLHGRLEIKIDDEIPDRGILTIDLVLKDDKTEKKYKIDITAHAPELEIVNCVIDDSATGNNNFIADPGESFSLLFQVRNLGSSNTSGQIEVQSDAEDLKIFEPQVKSGNLQFGENSYIRVSVKLSETARFGDFISLLSTLNCSPYIVNRDFTFRVGKVRESFESSTFRIFPWINISEVPWTINKSNSVDGNISARSGMIAHNGTSSLMIRTLLSEDDSLKFWYKVSSEQNYDYLQFKLNDEEILKASGETSWLKKAVSVPAGANKMEWIFKKDNSVSQGEDCAWIDLIDFSVSNPVHYIQRDLEVARIVNPVQKTSYELEPVTVRLLNPGKDTLNGFNLAYTINNNIPVRQNFSTVLYPYQDSATVTFDKRADLDLNGMYKIQVFAYGNDDDYLANDTLNLSIENTELNEIIKAYPNPFTDRINILITANNPDKIRISLTNAIGKTLVSINRDIIAGENVIVLETPKFGSSMYLLTVSGFQLYKVIPLIKVRQ